MRRTIEPILQDTVRAAVQAEIDALPRKLRRQVRLATIKDSMLITALGLALSYCDWSRVEVGQVPFQDVLQEVPVVTLDKKRVLVFQVYRPVYVPKCEVVNVVIDESLPLAEAARAVLLGAVPVYRALIKLGFTTTYGAESEAVLPMVRALGLPIRETVEGVDTEAGKEHYAFELDMMQALAVMERVLGL